MSFAKDFKTIESLDFIVQFSVLSGFTLLVRAFANDATVEALRAKIRAQPDACQAVANRINQVLTKSDVELYDESIAAYLYCLWKVDPGIALTASNKILEAGGQWWAVQLALRIIKEAQTEPA